MAVRALYEPQPGSLAQLLRHFDRHGKTVGGTPNSIRAEKLACLYHLPGASSCVRVVHRPTLPVRGDPAPG
ncbi:hypothetical protein SXCC_01790 [Gluconacetobacter sp. SXCC-1]|nr:hypothetical protein SXCC_01790 [Gluconacetobacter sp. SXCC-1]